jgi:hypothetical protein
MIGRAARFSSPFRVPEDAAMAGRDNENSCPSIFPCVRGLAPYPALFRRSHRAILARAAQRLGAADLGSGSSYVDRARSRARWGYPSTITSCAIKPA